MSKKLDLNTWIEGTIIAAMGMILSLVPIGTANASFDLSLGLVPLALYAYRRGLVAGMIAGFVWGMLNIVLGSAMSNFITVPQLLFEYPFAFAFGGMNGLFAQQVQAAIKEQHLKTARSYLIIGSIVSVVARWFWHFWAGVLIWGSYAPSGVSPYWYSLLFNGSSALANSIYVSVVMLILLKIAPKLFIPKKSTFHKN